MSNANGYYYMIAEAGDVIAPRSWVEQALSDEYGDDYPRFRQRIINTWGRVPMPDLLHILGAIAYTGLLALIIWAGWRYYWRRIATESVDPPGEWAIDPDIRWKRWALAEAYRDLPHDATSQDVADYIDALDNTMVGAGKRLDFRFQKLRWDIRHGGDVPRE